MQKLVINRSKWYRGKSSGSKLLREDGKMCCLGFFSLACGLSAGTILNMETPDRIPSMMPNHLDEIPKSYRFLYQQNEEGGSYFTATPIAQEMMATNDSPVLSGEFREQHLKELFLQKDWEVEFVD